METELLEWKLDKVLENQERIEEKLDKINNKLDSIQDVMSEGVDESELKHIMDMYKNLR